MVLMNNTKSPVRMIRAVFSIVYNTMKLFTLEHVTPPCFYAIPQRHKYSADAQTSFPEVKLLTWGCQPYYHHNFCCLYSLRFHLDHIDCSIKGTTYID